MCALSNTKIGSKDISVYMGYFGGEISIGKFNYDTEKPDADRDALIMELNKFGKEELAHMIANLIDNAKED